MKTYEDENPTGELKNNRRIPEKKKILESKWNKQFIGKKTSN